MISMLILLYFSTINKNYKAFLCELWLLKHTVSKILFGSLTEHRTPDS